MYFVVGTVCTIYQELNLPVTSSFYDYIYRITSTRRKMFLFPAPVRWMQLHTITYKFVVKNLKLTLLFF